MRASARALSSANRASTGWAGRYTTSSPGVGAPELAVGELLDVVAPRRQAGKLDQLRRAVVGAREIHPAREEAHPRERARHAAHDRLGGLEAFRQPADEALRGVEGAGRAESGGGEGEHGRGVARGSTQEGGDSDSIVSEIRARSSAPVRPPSPLVRSAAGTPRASAAAAASAERSTLPDIETTSTRSAGVSAGGVVDEERQCPPRAIGMPGGAEQPRDPRGRANQPSPAAERVERSAGVRGRGYRRAKLLNSEARPRTSASAAG